MDFLKLPTPLEEIEVHPGNNDGIKLFIKRDDLIHAEISGNKWRKLKHNIEKAVQEKATSLISAGGAWSNHLAALAAAGKLLRFETVGIIRGEEPPVWSDTLVYCKSQGMRLIFISRREFDKLPGSITQYMLEQQGGYYIPVGAENERGVKGCEEIITELDITPDYFCLPVGTGTTMKGVGRKLNSSKLVGFSALKESSQHSTEFLKWVEDNTNTQIKYEYSLGGFAKSSAQLENFIVDFFKNTKTMLEPVYTGKMMLGVFDMLEKKQFIPGSSIVCLHTGGLQGLKGYPDLHSRLFTS